jgi:putative aldouronate transport system substrate-binding protein
MKRQGIVLIVVAVVVIAAAVVLYFVLAAPGGGAEAKEYSIFLGYPKEDYPQEGTIFGDWLEEQTGVTIDWEFIVGDLEQKVGLIAASGDYPDAIHPRNETQTLLAAGALIPLDDLIASNGPNIQALYGDLIEMIRLPADGHIYWFPQQMPYGDMYRNPNPGHGTYVQAAVLESWDYQIPADLDEMADLLIDYADANPEYEGNPTYAWSGCYDTWRWFSISNIPHILSGHPNDGSVNVDWVDGRWVASNYWGTQEEHDSYQILNRIFQAGYFDTEAFVTNYDGYLAKLSTGSVLAMYDQDWQFDQAQQLLLEQDDGRWYVALPVMLPGYPPTIMNPPGPQVSEGIGISTSCDDPEGLMDYFDFLAERDTLLRRMWGREGIDYIVGSDGVFTRDEEMIERWRNIDWRNQTYGADYWSNFLRIDSASVLWDGLNNADPGFQPSIYRLSRRDNENAMLDALGIDYFAELFPGADMSRSTYFPAWTITIPPDSVEGITGGRVEDVRRRNIPLLVMAGPGQYERAWNAYMAELAEIPAADIAANLAFFQREIDRRVEAAGGY